MNGRSTDRRDPRPDSEPRQDRLARIVARVADEQRKLRTAGGGSACPIDLAYNRTRTCMEGDCVFFMVPGVPQECAIRHWAPEAPGNKRLAAWFAARRGEAMVRR
jgi:hypothetical protein